MKRLLLGAVLVSALSIVPSTLNAQNGQDREHDQQTHTAIRLTTTPPTRTITNGMIMRMQHGAAIATSII